jgi:hypothetical protein
MDSSTTPPTPRPPQARYTCPHCGGELDLSAPALSPIATDPRVSADAAPMVPAAPPPGPLAHTAERLLVGLFPVTGGLRRPQPALVTPPGAVGAWARWGRRVLPLLPLGLILLWLIVRAVGGIPMASATPHAGATPLPTPTPTIGAVLGSLAAPPPEQAAILAVVAQYNAADQQVAATQTLDAIRPFLDETGPLLTRRSQELEQRKQTGAAHTTRLLRWAVGAITIDAPGTTATLVTQETWENQEAGAVAPITATVRVTYTLRRATAHAPWRIYDAASTIL